MKTRRNKNKKNNGMMGGENHMNKMTMGGKRRTHRRKSHRRRHTRKH